MNDADIELLRAATPEWDQLREQRVLGRVEAQLSAGPAKAVPPSAGPAMWRVFVAVAVIVVCTLGGAAWWLAAAPPERTRVASTTRPKAAAVSPEPSTLRLPDGSVAQMDARAHVDVEVQTDALVRLLQTRGAVRYDVSRDATREFVVDVGDVRVRVLGTAFTITRDATGDVEMMSVEVHHGRVEVRRGERRTELGKGETLRMELHEPDPASVPTSDETGEPDLLVVDDGDEPRATPPPKGPGSAKPGRKPASVNALLLRADQARADGRLSDAASALRDLVRHHNKDTQAYSAWFQLGKVERARGRHGAAAAAFARCAKRSPRGALSEDARAEAAASWHAAGKTTRAYEAAETYLARHPRGTHVARMQRIVASTP